MKNYIQLKRQNRCGFLNKLDLELDDFHIVIAPAGVHWTELEKSFFLVFVVQFVNVWFFYPLANFPIIFTTRTLLNIMFISELLKQKDWKHTFLLSKWSFCNKNIFEAALFFVYSSKCSTMLMMMIDMYSHGQKRI